jgi:hypothetical protein
MKTTVSMAKNSMRRAIREVLDPSPGALEKSRIREHFNHQCAYCGINLDPRTREAHFDHADPAAGNGLYNLVLACATCNGDQKLAEHWYPFLRRKAPESAFVSRRFRIEAWVNQATPLRIHTAEVESARERIENLVEQFATECSRLRSLLRDQCGR